MIERERQDAITSDIDPDNPTWAIEKPWKELPSVEHIEAWINQYNMELQQYTTKAKSTGYGVCFSLTHGGKIFMHTTQGAILLDVTPDAEWAVPVITAATGIQAPPTQIWVLPDDVLTQLVLGLNSLISATRIVVSHNYKYKIQPAYFQ